MANSEFYDVLVVGAGIAGLVAANRAAEQGLAVLVVEKGAEDKYLCNSRYTGGFFHVGMQDLNNSPERLKEIIKTVTYGHADAALADALATDVRRGIDWLKANEIRFIRVGPEGYMSTVLAPPGLRQTGLHWEGRGGDVMLRTLGDRLARRGGALKRGVRALSLLMKDERCAGIEAREGATSQVFEAKAVVLADGGFQGDADRVKANISPRPDLVLHRGAATGCGDGARMASQVGAQLVRLDTFYGHVQHLGALKTDALWPYPVLDMIAAAGVVVDGQGKRFCDEGQGGIFISNAIAKLDDPSSAKVVFDSSIWEGPAKQFLLPANPYLRNTGAEIFETNDLAALAAKASIPAAALVSTVAEYNAAVFSGSFANLKPQRSAHLYKPYSITAAPFFAVPVVAGMTYTLGGILTDPDGRVMHCNGVPISGLYAAGATTGGLEGGPHAGYTGGLSKSLVFGIRCAENIAKQIKQN